LFVHNYCNYTKKLKKRVEKLLSFNLTHFWLFINLSGTLKHFISGSFYAEANSIQIEQK